METQGELCSLLDVISHIKALVTSSAKHAADSKQSSEYTGQLPCARCDREPVSSLSLRAKTYESSLAFIWKQIKELPFNRIHPKSQGRHKVSFLCFLMKAVFPFISTWQRCRGNLIMLMKKDCIPACSPSGDTRTAGDLSHCHI